MTTTKNQYSIDQIGPDRNVTTTRNKSYPKIVLLMPGQTRLRMELNW